LASGELSRLYNLLGWPGDPYTCEGRARYEGTIKEAEKIINHEWFSATLKGKDSVKILDVCGGSGIAGAALAKALREKGVKPEVIVIDLREEALSVARKFIEEEIGVKPETLALDVTRMHDANLNADLAVLWGLSTPHFSPWDLMKVVSGVASNLVADGVLVIEEFDRHAGIFLANRYQYVMPELVSEDRVTVTVHEGRDPITGYVSRVLVDLTSRETTRMKVYFWDIASVAAITWAFFKDVDFIPGKSSRHGYIIAKWPRETLKPTDLGGEEPTLLKKRERN